MNTAKPFGLILFKKQQQDHKVLKDMLQLLKSHSPGKVQSFSYVEARTSLHPELSLWENLQLEAHASNWKEFQKTLKPDQIALTKLIKNPHQKGRKEKVALALSGGLDSLVMAYLLKIQKYDLMAITIVNAWDDYPGDQGNILSCHISAPKLQSIKDFCHKMGIPLQVVKANTEFKDRVIEDWMSEKIMGRKTRQCWTCHDLLMNLLYKKMKEFGATKLATGHYAKLFHHEVHKTVFVHTSNDEANDQSALLSRLKHDILSHLILPLSDLTKKEVLKLGENFGVGGGDKKLKMFKCLPSTEEMTQILEKKIPKKFIKEGEITSLDTTLHFGNHEGVHAYDFGEAVEMKENGKPVKGVFSKYSYSDKTIFVTDKNYLVRDKLVLVKCQFSEDVFLPEPTKGFVIFPEGESIECWIHPKSLSSVYLELSEKHLLIQGDILTVVKKKGKNAKVLLTGQVLLLPVEPVLMEGAEAPPKADYRLDF